jgi:hypothetical protein
MEASKVGMVDLGDRRAICDQRYHCDGALAGMDHCQIVLQHTMTKQVIVVGLVR